MARLTWSEKAAHAAEVLNGERRRDGPVFADGQIQGRHGVVSAFNKFTQAELICSGNSPT